MNVVNILFSSLFLFIMDESEKIEIYCDEVREILSRPPAALLRWGTLLIGAVLSVVLAGSLIFSYPDTITGKAVISTMHPPVWALAGSGGGLSGIYCTDGQMVSANQMLAVIRNPALTTDVMELTELLRHTVVSDSVCCLPGEFVGRALHVGSIQPAYSAFVKAVADYHNFCRLNTLVSEQLSLRQQLSKRRRYVAALEQQCRTKSREATLAASLYERDRQLFTAHVLSAAELETSEQRCLTTRQELLQLRSGFAYATVEQTQLQGNAGKLEISKRSEGVRLVATLRNALHELNAAVEAWRQAFVVQAPVSGMLTFFRVWAVGQNVSVGDRVFAVVPPVSGVPLAHVAIPVQGAGKVKAGQQVQIRLDGYPYQEFGSVRAVVSAISPVTDDAMYMVRLRFPDGLKLSVHKRVLNPPGELQGTALIRTDHRSLFARIVSPLTQWKDYLTDDK